MLFHAAIGLDAIAIERVQEAVRQRLLHVFVRRGPLPGAAAQAMAQWEHGSGFSVDASVCIAAAERMMRREGIRRLSSTTKSIDEIAATIMNEHGMHQARE